MQLETKSGKIKKKDVQRKRKKKIVSSDFFSAVKYQKSYNLKLLLYISISNCFCNEVNLVVKI